MSIYTIEPLDDICLRILSSLGVPVHQIDRNQELINSLSVQNVEILICRDRDDISSILDVCPNLKLLFIVSVGVEKLPFDKIYNRNILVANTGGINADIMSNYAMGAILTWSCRIKENIINQEHKIWKRNQCVDSLEGKKLLIVGAGRTGIEIAKKAKSFGMIIGGVKKNIYNLEHFNDIISLEQLDDHLHLYDYIICTLPSTPKTYHLFDISKFSRMKDTAIFINISRGNIVVESDILKALSANIISGAVLDVFESEPLDINSPLWDTPNLIITPHSSGRMTDFMYKAMDIFITNYRAFCEKRELPNKVDLLSRY